MTVTTTVSRISYTGDGTSTVFSVPFYFLLATDLAIFADDAELVSGYSVSGAGVDTGGSVVFDTAPGVGVDIQIVRDPDSLQNTHLPPNDPFPSKAVETGLDKLTMLVQRIIDRLSRIIQFPDTETTPNGTLPLASARANHLFGFDSLGGISMYPVTASVGAGDMRVDTFTSGVDFTPGVTTSLTLSRAPGSQANAEVFYDGVFQGPDQWSAIGTTLTFNAPIPVGVGKVYVRLGTTLSTQTPPNRSVGDPQLSWGDILSRQVANVAALRALDTTVYSRASTKGYYNPGDGGEADFYLDAADNTTPDNNGTVIAPLSGTGRWKMTYGDVVSARCFGVIPGVSNVGARLNQALVDHLNKYRLTFPWGQILTGTTIIDIPGGADCGGVGPVNSNYGPIISTAPHGTQIVSAVPNDYAVRIAYNTPMVLGGTNVGNFEITNPAGKGMYCQSMGTGAIIHDIGIHDCLQKGAHFSYFQDSSLINLEVVFCGADTDYGVTFDINCNACRIDKLLIVGCRQPLLVQDSTYFDFYNPHIEQGEYPPGDPNEVLNRAYIGGGFKLQNCQSINFYGGVYVPNSSGYLATFYSIAESTTPFYLVTDAFCKNIKMFGPKFSSPRNGSRFLSVTNMEVIGGTFNNAVSTVTAVEGTNLKIRDGQAELFDNQAQTNLLFGFFGGRSEVSDFEIVCSNPSSTTKSSGALIDGVVDVGRYKITVDKYFSQLGNNAIYRGPTGISGTGYSLSTGTLDIQKQNAGDAIIINTIASSLLSLNNYHGQGDKYTVVNNTGGSLTVGTGGNISTPSTITVPAFGSIDLKHIPGTNILSPVV